MSLVTIEKLNIELSGKNILTDINLIIEKGEMTFLIGKTGSGKTTLINHYMVTFQLRILKNLK